MPKEAMSTRNKIKNKKRFNVEQIEDCVNIFGHWGCLYRLDFVFQADGAFTKAVGIIKFEEKVYYPCKKVSFRVHGQWVRSTVRWTVTHLATADTNHGLSRGSSRDIRLAVRLTVLLLFVRVKF